MSTGDDYDLPALDSICDYVTLRILRTFGGGECINPRALRGGVGYWYVVDGLLVGDW